VLRLPPVFFLRFWSANRALAAVAHFADLICQKCSESLGFVTLWSANLALATVSCTFCRQLPQIEPRNHGNRDPMGPSRIIRKHKGFRTRECFRPWIRTLNCCYTSQLLDGWHDDVGDKMVWMLTMTIVRDAKVFQAIFLWWYIYICIIYIHSLK